MIWAKWFLPGGVQRIESEMRSAERGDKGVAFTMALCAEVAGKLESQIEELRAEIAERQKSLADHYSGPWRIDQRYQRNALVTHRNSLWLALTQTDAEPGSGPHWKMVSKGGKPA